VTEFRVLADENTSPDVAARLREHGRTATHVTDALDFGVTDQEIVTYAEEHEYVVLTHDDDFLRPNPTSVPILYYADDTLATETLVERVETVIDCVPSPSDLPPVTYLGSWG